MAINHQVAYLVANDDNGEVALCEGGVFTSNIVMLRDQPDYSGNDIAAAHRECAELNAQRKVHGWSTCYEVRASLAGVRYDDAEVLSSLADWQKALLPAIKAQPALDAETQSCVDAFVIHHGPSWRSALGIAWGNGADVQFPNGHLLRALRNSPAYGHSWLDAYQPDAFALCTAHYEALQDAERAASAAWNAIPGIGSGQMGLTPDHIKFSAAYREGKARYDGAARRLKVYASQYVKWFKKELAAARKARRQAIEV